MEPIVLNLVGLAIMFVLLAMGMPIGFAMGAIGTAGAFLLIGVEPSLSLLGLTVYETVITNDLSVVPLFVLMGFFAIGSGLSEDLYGSCNTWLGHRRGGLALATIGGCGAFAVIFGSSLATAVTMSQVALPEMRRYRYDERPTTGAIAAGGTIGILIPPSVILVLYGILTDASAGQKLAAIKDVQATIILIYLFLGCALDALEMILPTIPIFFPVIQQLEFDSIWFGVIVVMVVELGLITPPVGMNVFVIKGMVPDVALSRIYSGVLPFVVAEGVLDRVPGRISRTRDLVAKHDGITGVSLPVMQICRHPQRGARLLRATPKHRQARMIFPCGAGALSVQENLR